MPVLALVLTIAAVTTVMLRQRFGSRGRVAAVAFLFAALALDVWIFATEPLTMHVCARSSGKMDWECR
jgi:hypothetical protein